MTVVINGDSGMTTPTGVFADGSGNVGIGTSSPTSGYLLDVRGRTRVESASNYVLDLIGSGTNASTVQVYADNSLAALVATGTSAIPMTFYTGGSERARIDSAGQFYTKDGAGNLKAAYAARAWVNFNGTGTVAIRASGNVSSITDNGVGDYTVNFTTAMSDTNYAVMGTGGESTTSLRQPSTNYGLQAPTTTTARIQIVYQNGAVADSSYVNIAVFR